MPLSKNLLIPLEMFKLCEKFMQAKKVLDSVHVKLILLRWLARDYLPLLEMEPWIEGKGKHWMLKY